MTQSMSPLEDCECSILLTSGKKETARHDAGLRRRSGASFGPALKLVYRLNAEAYLAPVFDAAAPRRRECATFQN